jgi:hypothetical protein
VRHTSGNMGMPGFDFVRGRRIHAAVGTPYLPKPITGTDTSDGGDLVVPKSFFASRDEGIRDLDALPLAFVTA